MMKHLGDLAAAVDAKNYDDMKAAAHGLKGSSGYIGAGRIHWQCYHIQEQWIEKNYD